MLKTYNGSCHCGAVKFVADIDLGAGTGKCNCSICAKRRGWEALIKPDAFRLLAGEKVLSDYQFGPKSAHHPFCSACGCAPFLKGHIAEIGGDFVAVSINCLDGLTPEELAAIPVRFANGLEDDWTAPPAVTSYL